MSLAYKIKLTNSPNQSSILQVQIDGVARVFKIELSYREICGYWTMNLIDWKTKKEILANIPFVTGKYLQGAGNFLSQFAYKGLGEFGICRTTKENTTDYPNDQNINTEFAFYWRVS